MGDIGVSCNKWINVLVIFCTQLNNVMIIIIYIYILLISANTPQIITIIFCTK